MPEKFDIYSKIFYRDVKKFVQHLCLLVLRHQMRVVSAGDLKVCCVGKMQYAELICTNPVLFTSDAQNTTYVSLSKVVRKLVRQSL
jgi:hypothetical protein